MPRVGACRRSQASGEVNLVLTSWCVHVVGAVAASWMQMKELRKNTDKSQEHVAKVH